MYACMDANILIVEDDQEITDLVSKYLQKEGYRTRSASDGLEACEMFAADSYQLVLLDLMIPKFDGFEVLRRIREKGNVPVVILSAKNEETSKILGLGLGADDYLTKPFTMGELIARVKAQLRRFLYMSGGPDTPEEAANVLKHGSLELNLDTYQVHIGDETKTLTAKEFEILKLFMKNPTRVFSKAQIFQVVWNSDFLTDENTVMVHIRRLRTKIESDPSNPQFIQTVWGIGYKLGEGRSE